MVDDDDGGSVPQWPAGLPPELAFAQLISPPRPDAMMATMLLINGLFAYNPALLLAILIGAESLVGEGAMVATVLGLQAAVITAAAVVIARAYRWCPGDWRRAERLRTGAVLVGGMLPLGVLVAVTAVW